ncbi:MAG: hypothetical protein ACI88H_002388 [Cocleimonas sp.]|jgi:hypothetical protein
MKDPNLKAVDEALKTHYASKSLSENQHNELLAMQISAFESQTVSQKEGIQKTEIKTRWWDRLFPTSYRYAFYMTAFMFLGCLFAVYKLLDHAPLSQRIMNEIVYNHKQDMPIEIASDSLTDIGEYLNKLGFSIILPSALAKPNWKFLGGRYCSINGKLAAQLKIKNMKDNNTYTFYQASVGNDLKKSGVDSMSDTIDGVGVSIWQEKGLLLGLARENMPFLSD